MSGGNNLPPGGGFTKHDEGVEQVCKNGHRWSASMHYELGGWFYDNEEHPEHGAFCPTCDEEALPYSPETHERK